MANIIQNSFMWRVFSTLVISIYKTWQKGAIYKLFCTIPSYYEMSSSNHIWRAFCGARDITRLSIYYRFMSWVRKHIYDIGDILRESLFYRGVILLRNLYFRITNKSVIFSWVHKLSLQQWILVAFVLYLPIGYMIRNKINIYILAAVWEELFILISVTFILWRRALRQSKAIGRETPLDAYIFLFMAVGLLLMSAVNPYPDVAFDGYRAVVGYILWFFIVIRLIENDKDFKVAYYTFLGMGALLCLHGIYQYIIAVPIPATWVSQTEMGVRTRVFSLTGSPNIFGSLIVLLAPMAAAMIYYSKKTWIKLMFCCLTAMMCLCLLFTFSRGAWVGIVAAVILFALYVDRRLLGLMAVAVAGVLLLVPSITSRLTYLFTSDYAEASAIGGRTLRWATGRMLLMENSPWLGFGLGRFGGAVAMNNKLLDETEEFSYFYMDNYYLKTMVEMGYLGIIFYVILLAALVIWGLRAVYRSGLDYRLATNENDLATEARSHNQKDPLLRAIDNPKILAVGIFSGLVGVLVHCYFENIFEEPYMMAYFWGLTAMLMYLGLFRKGAYLLPNK